MSGQAVRAAVAFLLTGGLLVSPLVPVGAQDVTDTGGTQANPCAPDIPDPALGAPLVDILPTPTATPAPAAEPTASPEPTATPEPTAAPEPTASPEPTATPEPTAAPEPTTTVKPEVDHETELIEVNGKCITIEELQTLLAGYESTVAEEAEALAELASQLEKLTVLNERLSATDIAIANVIRRVAGAETEIRFAAQRELTAGRELEAIRIELVSQRLRLRDQAVAAYVSGSNTASTVQDRQLDPQDLNQFGSIRTYGRAVVEDQYSRVEIVAALEVGALALETELEDAKARAVEAVADAESVRATAEVLRTAQEELITEAEKLAEEQAELVASIQARRDEFAGELGLELVASGNLAAALAAIGEHGATLVDVGRLGAPLLSTRIGSGFGPRLHPIFGTVRQHTGLDLSATAGTPILAVADGVIAVASEEGGYGFAVVVDHGKGISTLSAHMSAFAVEVGDIVESGDIIGFVGSTGFSTGPHLHIEIRLGGTPIDPLPFLDLRVAGSD